MTPRHLHTLESLTLNCILSSNTDIWQESALQHLCNIHTQKVCEVPTHWIIVGSPQVKALIYLFSIAWLGC